MPSVSVDDSDYKGVGETSVKQVLHRLVGTWTFWGWTGGYFNDESGQKCEEYAKAFYDETIYMLYHQMAAPNSPQFFNTGLWWAYGIEGKACGHKYTDADGKVHDSPDLYSHSQAHACFILGLEDNLLDDGGIYDLLKKEARIFKLGSGAGTNFSALRAEGESLSGGGSSSGLMSFLRIFDRAADCIKSGGITRRAAKMLVVDSDHPDILEYINWKSEEEKKAKALISAGYEADFNGEAYKTISGQNGNNSIAVSHDFMSAVQKENMWNLWWRLDKEKHTNESGATDYVAIERDCEPAKTLQAKEIWDAMVNSSWKCADPGVHFNSTMNDWNTLANDGWIHSTNPCSEYISLNDTACNLASINVVPFYSKEDGFDIDKYKHAVRLWQFILDLTNNMAQLPSKEVSYNVYKYRNTGLGPANLGTLLMLMGLPYASKESYAISGALMSIMTGHSYVTSAEMSDNLGAFPGYEKNRKPMIKVIKNHQRAAYGLSDDMDPMKKRSITKKTGDYEDLTVNPVALNLEEGFADSTKGLIKEAQSSWDEALSMGGSFGFRNGQVTVCAPTGTIAMVMGCDSTGIEPCYALVTYKTLAGGGIMKIVNNSVSKTLSNLGYDESTIESICKHVQVKGHVYGSEVREEHIDIFKCAASPLGNKGTINWEGHIQMLAALQSFVSGGISKTINMPESSTREDISNALVLGYDLGCKGISIYRDNCKMSAPLTTNEQDTIVNSEDVATRITSEALFNELARRKAENAIDIEKVLETLGITNQDIVEARNGWGQRRRPGDVLNGFRFRIKIGQAQGYVQIFIYPDGRICEFFLTFGNPGSSLNNMLECWSIAFSIALQRGESLSNLCSKFINVEFEPKGFTGRKDDLKRVVSPVDYIARLMLKYFDDEGYVKDPSVFSNLQGFKPEEKNVAEKNQEVLEYQSEDSSFDQTSMSRPCCPKCGAMMTEGTDKCPACPSCGYFGGRGCI